MEFWALVFHVGRLGKPSVRDVGFVLWAVSLHVGKFGKPAVWALRFELCCRRFFTLRSVACAPPEFGQEARANSVTPMP